MHNDPTEFDPPIPPPPPPANIFNPYLYPPPPIRSKKTGSILLAWITGIIGLALIGFVVFYGIAGFNLPWQKSYATTPSFTASTKTVPTNQTVPTAPPTGPLDSPDFPTFIAAFNNNIASGNWNTIAIHTDTTNFLNQYSYSGDSTTSPVSGNETWLTTLTDLQNDRLVTKVDLPPNFLNINAGLNCAQYSPNGVAGHQVDAHQIYYVYAWGLNDHLSVNGVIINPLRQIDAFEQANRNGSWQWLGIFSNMVLNSNNSITLDCER